jgi:ribosomal protein S2
LTKKEQASIKRQLAKTEKVYAWVKALTKRPDLVVVVDASQLGWLVAEIPHSNVQNIMLCSTDFAHRWPNGQMVVMNMNNQRAPLYVLDKLFA